MRLIDADALPYDEFLNGTRIVMQSDIDKASTVDAVEVVRCEDCKHWQDQEEGVVEGPICVREKPMVMEIGPHGYCSYGDRRVSDVDD